MVNRVLAYLYDEKLFGLFRISSLLYIVIPHIVCVGILEYVLNLTCLCI